MNENPEETVEDNSINLTRHKIVFVGDVSVGKTAIIKRFIDNQYKENYEPSIGVDFCSKSLRGNGKNLKLQIWDSAGQERYKSIIPSYIRNSSIIFVVFDVSRTDTFASVQTWINFVKNYSNSILVLCGNKIDLERKVQYEDAKKLASKEGLLYFEVSAKTNDNIKKMFYSSVVELPIFENASNKLNLINELEENNETDHNTNTLPNSGVVIKNDKKGSKKKNCLC